MDYKERCLGETRFNPFHSETMDGVLGIDYEYTLVCDKVRGCVTGTCQSWVYHGTLP